jgi:crotonobetainyl-CoA:carnitine CoA-transferase CaiB-like acyl-CoA transferase
MGAPRPMGSARPNIVPDQAFRTADGYISVCVPSEKFWPLVRAALNAPALAAERFATNDLRIAHREELVSILTAVFAHRHCTEWIERLRVAGVPCGIHEGERRQTDVLLEDEQVRANSMMQRVATPYGEIRSQAPHWKFDRTPAEIKRGSPLLGHDTERVFAALAGHAGSHQAPCREANRQPGDGHGSRGVLEGVRVLEIAEGDFRPAMRHDAAAIRRGGN